MMGARPWDSPPPLLDSPSFTLHQHGESALMPKQSAWQAWVDSSPERLDAADRI